MTTQLRKEPTLLTLRAFAFMLEGPARTTHDLADFLVACDLKNANLFISLLLDQQLIEKSGTRVIYNRSRKDIVDEFSPVRSLQPVVKHSTPVLRPVDLSPEERGRQAGWPFPLGITS